MTVKKLIEYGSITPEVAELLERMVKAKFNIFISGGTGSGKTTFLNALSNFIPRDERVITIEDSAELQLKGLTILSGWRHEMPIWKGKERLPSGI